VDLESAANGRGARRPEGAAVSRRPADPAVVKTLKGSVPLGARRKPGDWGPRKAHEGTVAKATGRRGGEIPRGRENQEGSGLPVVVHPIAGRWRILAESKALKATLSTREFFGFARFSDSSRANVTKVTASERGQRLCEGETP
jgi:hypothetical protein